MIVAVLSRTCRGYHTGHGTLGGLTYVRGTVKAAVGGTGLIPRNSHETVVSMAITLQPATQYCEYSMCAFVNSWQRNLVQRAIYYVSRDATNVTKCRFKAYNHLHLLHRMMCPIIFLLIYINILFPTF